MLVSSGFCAFRGKLSPLFIVISSVFAIDQLLEAYDSAILSDQSSTKHRSTISFINYDFRCLINFHRLDFRWQSEEAVKKNSASNLLSNWITFSAKSFVNIFSSPFRSNSQTQKNKNRQHNNLHRPTRDARPLLMMTKQMNF